MGFLVRLKGRTEEEIKVFLEIAVDNIIEGKIIAFPTNSVYGLGGDPRNLEVIEKIYSIKYRDKTKGLLLLVSDMEEASKIALFNKQSKDLAKHFWPGQLTLILNN